ncbi:M56 family metallopeptidase [Brevibacterium litoralis]|uniref:M56 family metallopeptidase n=1 Tax=Brevibacterium litoralis TaxID=3138935 RepID=UPI0032EF4B6F
MVLSGSVLVVLAVVLAWPIPLVLSRRADRYPGPDPISEVVLWQAVGLAGGLSLIGTALVFAVAPFSESLHDGLTGLLAVVRHPSLAHGLAWWQWILLVLAGILSVRLIGCLYLQWRDVRRHRRKHAALVELLTEPSEELPGTRVIPAQEPVAYCLPGRRSGTTVVSTGLLEALTPAQRRAVVTHEQAHLIFRHELLVLPFAAWNRALPFLPVTSAALRSVSSLIELMADDMARKFVEPHDLSTAIATTAEVYPGDYRNDLTEARVARLSGQPPTRRRSTRVTSLLLAAVLLLAPTVMLLGPVVRSLL